MAETGWQAIGRIAKARRERLGLNQDELARYGGPRVATVGKFERAAQDSFPLRTQHQMEKALGWTRTIIEQVVTSIDDGSLTADDWEHDLIHEDVPDMSRTTVDPDDAEFAESLNIIGSVLKLVTPARRDDAVRAAVRAMLPALTPEGATELGQGLRQDFPPVDPVPPRIYDELLVDEAAFDPEQDESGAK